VTRYLRNDALEIAPRPRGRLELRALHTGGAVLATAYQVGLLERFAEGATLEAVLAAFPFEREASRAFLDEAVEAGVLLALGDDGQAVLPDLVHPGVSLCGAPPWEAARPAAFVFLGVPFDGATTGHPGARFGPASVRAASEGARYQLDARTLAPLGFRDYARGTTLLEGVTLADAGDVRVVPGEDPARVFARLSQQVEHMLGAGSIVGVIGGDHSITLAALEAASRRAGPLTVVHFDAHTDLGAPGSGLDHGNIFTIALAQIPSLGPLVQVGLRGITELSEPEASAERVRAFGLHVARAQGIGAILAELPADRPCWISLDIDVLDPVFAPSTGTPVAGGAWPHELMAWLDAVASSRDVIGFDVVEIGATTGPADGTAAHGLEAILTIAGAIVRRMRTEGV
jgi:agmatinase